MTDFLIRLAITCVLGTIFALAWLHSHPAEASGTREVKIERKICANLDKYSNADEFRKYCKWRLTGQI